MKADRFYEIFEHSFASHIEGLGLKRLAGKSLKLKRADPELGSLTFAFATNAKTSGLLPHMPGEFRLRVLWTRGKGGDKRQNEVSWFQYTTESENSTFVSLQKTSLEKLLAQPDKEWLRRIYPCSTPRPNFDQYAYYFDEEDVHNWGRWYGELIGVWITRFTQKPESRDDWGWRVLWPHLERKRK